MKKGAIFDMDGLLFDTERLYHICWDVAAEKLGQKASPEFRCAVSGTSGDGMRAVVKKYYPAVDPDLYISMCLEQLQELEKDSVPPKPGMRDILDYFRGKELKLAVASSSPMDMIKHNLQVSGVSAYFDAVVSGLQVKRGKPAPDIFLYAARQLGLQPKDCYVFEDSLNGIRAGAAAGCTAIMIPDLVQPTEEIKGVAAGIYANLSQALEAIRQEEKAVSQC